MKRVLKPTGSIYLHCDPTASHYLKAAMDAIFGWRNFRNEIVWHYTGPQRPSKRNFGSKHDLILRYSKTDKYFTDPAGIAPFLPLTDDELKGYKKLEDGRYYYTLPRGDYTDKSVEKLKLQNRIEQTRTGNIRIRFFLPVKKGVVGRSRQLHDVWSDIVSIGHAGGNERVGYPTQKPLKLYERFIKASSNEGDVVLDPFAGCATTLVAAEKLERKWVGIDLWKGSGDLVHSRLHDTTGLFGNITFTDQLPERTDDAKPASPYLRVKEIAHEPEGPRWTRQQMYEYLLEQYGSKCQGCDRTFDDRRYLQLDHNTPRADGGLNHISNRVLLCGPCNRLKSNIYTLSGLRRQNNLLGYMT